MVITNSTRIFSQVFTEGIFSEHSVFQLNNLRKFVVSIKIIIIFDIIYKIPLIPHVNFQVEL